MDLGSLIATLGADLSDLQAAVSQAQETLKKYDRSVNRQLSKAEDRFKVFGRRVRTIFASIGRTIFSLKSALLAIGSGLVLRGFVRISAQFEQMQLKLNAITKGRGAETLERINKWAIEMPINTQRAVAAFSLMNAMGLKPTIKMMETLVDASVLFGEHAMGRIALALGQMSAMNRLIAQDLNQLAQAGINARKYLQAAFGTAVAEDINKMGIAIQDVIKVIVTGMRIEFGGAAREAMWTWQGVKSYLESMYTEITRQFAKAGTFKALKDAISSISKQMKNWLETQTRLKEMGLPNWFDDVAKAAQSLAGWVGKIAQYASLRSITGTIKQAVELSKAGKLGMPLTDFMRLGLLERQKAVDQALLNQSKLAKESLRRANEQIYKSFDEIMANLQQRMKSRSNILDFKKMLGPAGVASLAKLGEEALKRAGEGKVDEEKFKKIIRAIQLKKESLRATEAEQIALNAANKLGIKVGSELYKQILKEAEAYQQLAQQVKVEDFVKSIDQRRELLTMSKAEQLAYNAAVRIGVEIGSREYQQLLETAKAYQYVVEQMDKRKQLEQGLAELQDFLLSKEERIRKAYKARIDIVNKAVQEGIKSQVWGTETIVKLHEKMNQEIADLADTTFREEIANAMKGWASTWSSTLNDMVWSAEFSFNQILESFAKMMTQMAIQKAIAEPFMGWLSGFISSAKGNVFAGGMVKAFAKGGVVSKPVIFPMANGTGLMGEAGPEAVMPLKRTSTGELGVIAEGGGGPKQININIAALDAQSFVEMTRRNPQAIIGPLVQELYGGNITLRNALRKAG